MSPALETARGFLIHATRSFGIASIIGRMSRRR